MTINWVSMMMYGSAIETLIEELRRESNNPEHVRQRADQIQKQLHDLQKSFGWSNKRGWADKEQESGGSGVVSSFRLLCEQVAKRK